jgi:hypothetical protein
VPAPQLVGHIALCDGQGGTVEAHSTSTGVIRHQVSGRRWDFGVLVPGIRYFMADRAEGVVQPTNVLRLTDPMMRGARVRAVQQALAGLGLMPGDIDDIYGPQTQAAVRQFQAAHGLVADGEVGEVTWQALGLG